MRTETPCPDLLFRNEGKKSNAELSCRDPSRYLHSGLLANKANSKDAPVSMKQQS